MLKDTCLENQEIKKKIPNEKFSLRIQRACSMKCGKCVVCEGEGRVGGGEGSIQQQMFSHPQLSDY